MSLIVEDGSIIVGAESYASVAFADLYHSNHDNGAWTLLDVPAKEASLRKATDYMQQAYRLRWKGVRAGFVQILDWPRLNVQIEDVGFGSIQAYLPVNIVPLEVQNACASLALTASTEDLAPPLERETASESVGSISVSYVTGAPV
ncbi:MAG: DnaT-like ssDNA-binding protein, partial [Herbaspirillum sp.]